MSNVRLSAPEIAVERGGATTLAATAACEIFAVDGLGAGAGAAAAGLPYP